MESITTGLDQNYIDVSVVGQTSQAGVGVISRDSNSQVVFSARQAYDRCSDTLETEALACVEGLRKAVQGGL
jgi:ribonuclease HI